jgi:hypothetical protein
VALSLDCSLVGLELVDRGSIGKWLFACTQEKRFQMNIPTYTKPAFWGFAGGVVVCAVVGFMWGGWVTGSTARKDASAAAHTATVVALAPRCAEQFRAQPDAAAKIEALGKASSWERSSLVEKSGFAVLPSTKSSDSDIARACSEILLASPVPEKPKN